MRYVSATYLYPSFAIPENTLNNTGDRQDSNRKAKIWEFRSTSCICMPCVDGPYGEFGFFNNDIYCRKILTRENCLLRLKNHLAK